MVFSCGVHMFPRLFPWSDNRDDDFDPEDDDDDEDDDGRYNIPCCCKNSIFYLLNCKY